MENGEWKKVGYGPVYIRKTYTKFEGAPVIEVRVGNKVIQIEADNIYSELYYQIYEVREK